MELVRTTLFAVLICAATLWPRAATAAEPVTVLAGFGVQFMQVYVADKAKLFEKEGVSVTVKLSTTGKIAVDGLVAGAGVMSVSGVFPAVSAAATGPIYVITPVAIDDGDTKLIVRSGIGSPDDLKGKRVGYQLGTDGHLFILKYLEKEGMAESDITSRNVPVEGLVSAFARGDLDAVVVWEPIATKALKVVADSKVLAAKGVVPIYNPISMRKDFVENDPETARKLLKGLLAAHEFIKRNPDKAAEITAEVGQMDIGLVRELMDTYVYTMTIDDGFYNGIGAIADFLHLTGSIKNKADPRKLVYSALMKEVAPSNVK
jgi:ABC-type nitrate/sulfonate/bicarbonate transport system substrate-binding protein